MSVTLGIYDLFSYMLPGSIYLFTFNELFRTIGLPFFDLNLLFQGNQSVDAIIVIPLLVVSYVVGQLFESVAYRYYFSTVYFLRIKKYQKMSTSSLYLIADEFKDLNVQFKPRDWNVLLSIIQQRNDKMAQIIDKFQADSIMLRNISLVFFIMSILQIFRFFLFHEWLSLFFMIGSLMVSSLAFIRSAHFREWFFSSIFKASLEYGKNVKEVAEYNRHQI